MRLLLILLAGLAGALAQAPSPPGEVHNLPETPVFRVDVVSKTIKAVNYRQRASTRIGFVGSALMPRANGEAKISTGGGRIEIDAQFAGVGPANQFGAEYLTYVLWAVSPEGRASNLGEVQLRNERGRLQVTTDLQVFALLVTAEPYFSVSQPSDLIVLENEVRENTRARIHLVDAKYELLSRGQYAKLANPLELTVDLRENPLELYQARNAVHIAQASGAAEYAADTFSRAKGGLEFAEREQLQGNKRLVVQHARQAVQTAEEARLIAVRRQEQERIEAQQRAAAEKAARARAEAEQAAAEAERAELERLAEAQRRVQAEEQRALAEQSRLEAELAAAKAAARRAEAEAARALAELEQEQARREADAARMAAEEARQAAEEAQLAREEALREKRELRARLLSQFNQALETRDTERGLVVNMSDVLFDLGEFSLRPIAREKLARLAGILLTYPGLQIEAEGHTDITGTLEFNNKLSLQRAEAVRDYLVSQGIDAERITALGMGPAMPVAPNDTREGRQQNRRVEIIVSGEVIGEPLG